MVPALLITKTRKEENTRRRHPCSAGGATPRQEAMAGQAKKVFRQDLQDVQDGIGCRLKALSGTSGDKDKLAYFHPQRFPTIAMPIHREPAARAF